MYTWVLPDHKNSKYSRAIQSLYRFQFQVFMDLWYSGVHIYLRIRGFRGVFGYSVFQGCFKEFNQYSRVQLDSQSVFFADLSFNESIYIFIMCGYLSLSLQQQQQKILSTIPPTLARECYFMSSWGDCGQVYQFAKFNLF